MNLQDAMDFCFISRDTWREGKSTLTTRINSDHVIRILGPTLDVYDLETYHFTKLTALLKDEGKAECTINRITSVLSTMLTELRQNGYRVPHVDYKRQKEPSGRPGFYTREEMDLMLEVSKRFPDHYLLHDSILFALKTGCRQGEMLKVKREDIDFKNRLIIFRDVKTDGDHIIHMHEDLVGPLQRRIEDSVDDELFPWNGSSQILTNLRNLQRITGVSTELCWHSIRHTAATWMLEKEVPIRAVMGVLNHSNINTTLRYAKYTDKAVASAIAMI